MTSYDQGYDLFKRHPELLLAQVWWRAPKDFTKEQANEFVDGHRAARWQDEFEREFVMSGK
jgi:hypothetical protein